MYPDYLIHFNKLHSKSNGQFVRGDGDGDGTADEHHRYTQSGYQQKSQIQVNSAMVKSAFKATGGIAGSIFAKTKFGQVIGEMKKVSGYDSWSKGAKEGLTENFDHYAERGYKKVAEVINERISQL